MKDWRSSARDHCMHYVLRKCNSVIVIIAEWKVMKFGLMAVSTAMIFFWGGGGVQCLAHFICLPITRLLKSHNTNIKPKWNTFLPFSFLPLATANLAFVNSMQFVTRTNKMHNIDPRTSKQHYCAFCWLVLRTKVHGTNNVQFHTIFT